MKNLLARLLQSKNRSLRKLRDRSAAFLSSAPVMTPPESLKADAFLGGLDSYQLERARIFRAVELLDRKIAEATASGASGDLEEIQALAREGASLLPEILYLDRKISARIESEKAAILGDLATVQKSLQMSNKYKSNWMPESGEKLDQTL